MTYDYFNFRNGYNNIATAWYAEIFINTGLGRKNNKIDVKEEFILWHA